MVIISKQRYIYGLDLSMACSGVAIVDFNTLEPVLVTSVRTNQAEDHGDRLHEQRNFMKELIEKYPPERVYLEKGFTQFNTATQVVYRVVGVCNELFKDYPQEYYAPTTVKKTITGNGRASKEELQLALLEKYPDVKFEDTDASDALGVCYTGLIKSKRIKW